MFDRNNKVLPQESNPLEHGQPNTNTSAYAFSAQPQPLRQKCLRRYNI